MTAEAAADIDDSIKRKRFCVSLNNVISGQNIETIQGYAVVNFEVASFGTFLDFPKWSFCDGEVSDGSGGINAICSRPEVADDIISGKDVNTFRCYVRVNNPVWL